MGDQLNGKHALVTGAASGIGLAIGRRFIAEGAEVWLVDIDADAVAAAASGLDGAHAVVADITDPLSIERAVAEVGGRLDVVVANAGIQLIGADARIGDTPLDVWATTLDVNLTGTFHTLRAAVRRMGTQQLRAGSRGSVIVTGSPTAVTGEGAGFAAYSASKAGVHGLVRTTGMDYAAEAIRVNAVVPGHTLTPLVARLRADRAFASQVDARIPMGRPGEVDDVTGAYVYLASDDSAYATGGFIYVDGGMTNL